ncbi:hypothetical protein PV371_25145 [Streptomyces sp. TX20-6-3]|uniref:hypothetical protein n=1 Tax=Streptomyces sp. TX20-6-3 TaxID=3028705 RepID=UPI0029B9D8E9|nr:hypothetical protein [Streptomyces sp. TX20-6-3]MDX2562920.1 hypothetical protein [Streptomyces sp. TX20-6-3]
MTGQGPVAATDPPGDAIHGIDLDRRRALVTTVDPDLDGIDFIEVLSNHAGTPGHVPGAPQECTLAVHLLRGPVADGPGAGPGDQRVVILGGVRDDPHVNPVRVLWAYPAVSLAGDADHPPAVLDAQVTQADRELVAAGVPAVMRSRVLVVRTAAPGDRSTYVLRLHGPTGRTAPAGFDGPLAQAPFRFDVDCPSDLDCRQRATPPPPDVASPVQDYLARDYEALRTRLLDRMAVLLPEWTDRSAADVGVTLVELFAYIGDRLAYRQDSIAQEAHLGTARLRTSARRHARLLDHRVHEGCSARAWLAFTTLADVPLPAGTAVSGAGIVPGQDKPSVDDVVQSGAVVFETCHTVRLTRARNRLALHAWGDADRVLPAGTTSAFVSVPRALDPALKAGDVLVLAELGPTGTLREGDPASRCAVRLDRDPVERTDALTPSRRVLELHWHRDDALRTPLTISQPGTDRARTTAVALANIALADHGISIHGDAPEPARVPDDGRYRPYLRRTSLAWTVPADPAPVEGLSPDSPGWQSATDALHPDPRLAVAQLELDDGARRWLPRNDLLGSTGTAPHLVVETEENRSSRLRFGDGVSGRRPTPGSVMTVRYRIGGGSHGNVGVDTLNTILRLPSGGSLEGVTVTNPLPAAGGVDPQPSAEVRELAPRAFHGRTQAVTPEDYARIAVADSAVRQAVARPRWTGSWYALQVAVDPVVAADVELPGRLAALMELRRTAGVDVEFRQTAAVPLDIALVCCLYEGTLRSEAEQQVRDALSASVLSDGRRGFFHPDRLTLGSSVFLSDLIAHAMSVPGVLHVEVERFCRAGAGARENQAAMVRGRLDASPRESFCCASDPRRPEAGRVELTMRGGA